MEEIDPFSLTPEEEIALDLELDACEHSGVLLDASPAGWVQLTLSVPADFKEILYSTIEAYKKHTGSQKVFPALEAMVMEARNSLVELT